MKIIPAESYSNLSEIAALILTEKIKNTNKVVLGMATGGTPTKTYQFLADDYKRNKTSYRHVSTFNLDEYIGIDQADRNSYYYYMVENLFKYIDIPREQTHIPSGTAENLEQECRNYEQKIAAHGGIDLQLLGLGSNGHIGFNEPGTAFDTLTHVVDLTKATREANARFFNSIDEVPTQAITMGIASIMKSKEILLLVAGESKSKALDQLLNGQIDPSFPASILKNHPNVTIVADQSALKHINIPAELLG